LQGIEAADVAILDLRQRRILAKMEMLSDSPGASVVSTIGKRSKPGTKAPPGVRLTDARPGAPDKDRSLYDHYRYRFEKATEYPARLLICALAERDYLEHAQSSGGGRRRAAREDKTERDQRILTEYRGIPKLEAAVMERVSLRHIERLRVSVGHVDPELGVKQRPPRVA
jgi:hypothetical protein